MPLAPTDLPIVQSYRRWQEQSRLLERIQVVFIVGPPRCGTTWIMRTLNSHPQAAAHGESNLAARYFPSMQAAVQHFWANADRGAGKEFITDADSFFMMRQSCDRVLLNYAMRAAEDGKDRLLVVADKSPMHTRHVDVLARLYPWAKFVCCVRDVRDAAVSAWHYFHGYQKDDFFRGAETIEHAAELYARNHWAEMLRFARAAGERIGPGRYAEFAYEDHKQDPSREVSRLFTFLGLPADERAVRAIVEANSFRAESGGRPAGDEAAGALRKGVVGDWKENFSPEFGRFLIGVANERLALGEQIVTNTTVSTWTGEHDRVAGGAHAS